MSGIASNYERVGPCKEGLPIERVTIKIRPYLTSIPLNLTTQITRNGIFVIENLSDKVKHLTANQDDVSIFLNVIPVANGTQEDGLPVT